MGMSTTCCSRWFRAVVLRAYPPPGASFSGLALCEHRFFGRMAPGRRTRKAPANSYQLFRRHKFKLRLRSQVARVRRARELLFSVFLSLFLEGF